jgi:hypothetical protein
MRVHERDGKHRSESRKQRAQALGLEKLPRRPKVNRVQVRISRRPRGPARG